MVLPKSAPVVGILNSGLMSGSSLPVLLVNDTTFFILSTWLGVVPVRLLVSYLEHHANLHVAIEIRQTPKINIFM